MIVSARPAPASAGLRAPSTHGSRMLRTAPVSDRRCRTRTMVPPRTTLKPRAIRHDGNGAPLGFPGRRHFAISITLDCTAVIANSHDIAGAHQLTARAARQPALPATLRGTGGFARSRLSCCPMTVWRGCSNRKCGRARPGGYVFKTDLIKEWARAKQQQLEHTTRSSGNSKKHGRLPSPEDAEIGARK